MNWNKNCIGGTLGLLAATGLLCSATPAAAAPLYYFVTGQTGAQTQLDANHTTSWSFTATSAWTLGGGDFAMKDGSSTSANIALSLYQGTSSAGTLLDSLTLTAAAFCTLHTGNCGSFNSTPFHFATPFTLTAGLDYYLTLTSFSSDVQSQAYFIKDPGAVTISDSNGTALPGQTVGPAPAPTSIPEPASLALGATLLAGLTMHLGRKGMAGAPRSVRA
jgi:hypothetical protein